MKCYKIDIVLTEKCNLSCVYCFERKKSCVSASVNNIKKIISEEFKTIPLDMKVQVEFHGGEVLCAFEELKYICEWLWSTYTNRLYYVCFRTNGTLMHGHIAEWFEKNHESIRVGLSLDGTERMQNVNRNGSFSLIDIDFFRRFWPLENLKMTITPDTIGYVSEGVKYLHSLGFPIISNLADGVVWGAKYTKVYFEQLQDLVKWYVKNKHICPASLLTPPIDRIGRMDRGYCFSHDCKWCEAGEANRIAYSVCGNRYPCVGFISSAIEDEESWQKINFSKFEIFKDPKCSGCKFFGACATCCAQNLYYRGNVAFRDEQLCKFRKLEIISSARMYGKMLQDVKSYECLKTRCDTELSDLARGCITILKEL